MAAELASWFARQQKAVLATIPAHETYPLPKTIAPVTDWSDPMAWAMVPYLAPVWSESATAVAARLGLDATQWHVTNPHLRDAVHGAALTFCKATNETTSKALDDALAQLRAELVTGLVEKGESIARLRARVTKAFEHAETWRAHRIAATETSRAYHTAQASAAAESGVVAGFELLLSSDACDLCRKIATEARRVRLGQAFAIIGHHPDYAEVRYPPLHPLCQCDLIEILTPEAGGPSDPGWSDTLVQPQEALKDGPYKAPKGKREPAPDPTRRRPTAAPRPPTAPPPPGESTPPKDAPDRPDESHHRPTNALPDPARPMPPDLSLDRLRQLDLHAVEPSWHLGPNAGRLSYGTVIFDEHGRVLLREPRNHYDGYHWTFAKGGKDPGEHPVDTALRETREETGVDAAILGLVPGGHKGGTGSTYFFVARAQSQGPHGSETQGQRWVTLDEAKELVGKTTNATGRARDLGVLKAASEHFEKLRANPGLNDHLKPPKPAEPPPPPPPPKPVKPVKAKAAPKAWPADPDALTLVKRLGGSTGAELVEDSNGKRFVRKRGANADHLREECLADAAYQSVGAKVPKFHLYEGKGGAGPVKLSEYLDGARTLAEIETADPKLYQKAVKQLARHFAADAWFGNWDVVGMGSDNVLVDAKGNAWRIDNGGSFRFRAQGARKSAAEWDPYPTELWTLRDKAKNPQTAKVFGSVTAKEIAGQVRELAGKTLAALPADLAASLAARLAQLTDVADRVELLTGDDFKDHYADQFCRHTVGIRKAGIADKMPTVMTNGGSGVMVKDQNGKPWDHLRGTDSLVARLEKYVAESGGDYGRIPSWMEGQAGTSWSTKAIALKSHLLASRGQPAGKSFWLHPPSAAAAQLKKEQDKAGGADRYAAAMTAMHAFTYEYLTRADFKNKDAAKGTVRLMRTEPLAPMQAAGLKRGDRDVIMPRGLAESFSIYERVTVSGSEMTRQDMPLHRVLATYWQCKKSTGYEAQSAAFAGDHENEFVCIPEGIRFDYDHH